MNGIKSRPTIHTLNLAINVLPLSHYQVSPASSCILAPLRPLRPRRPRPPRPPRPGPGPLIVVVLILTKLARIAAPVHVLHRRLYRPRTWYLRWDLSRLHRRQYQNKIYLCGHQARHRSHRAFRLLCRMAFVSRPLSLVFA